MGYLYRDTNEKYFIHVSYENTTSLEKVIIYLPSHSSAYQITADKTVSAGSTGLYDLP